MQKALSYFLIATMISCADPTPFKIKFDSIKNQISTSTGVWIREVFVYKYDSENNLICEKQFLENAGGGSNTLNLLLPNSGYTDFDSLCLFEKGFIYKFYVYSLGNGDSLKLDWEK